MEHHHPPQPQARLSALQSEGWLAVAHARVVQAAGALVIEHAGATEQKAPWRQRTEEHLAHLRELFEDASGVVEAPTLCQTTRPSLIARWGS